MKKVLIIGYPFPLRQGGSPRLLGLAKYLPEFGWQPIILTAPLDAPSDRYRIIETPCRDPLVFWRKLFRFNPDDDIRWQVKKRLRVTAKKSPMDFMLTRIGEIVNYPDSEKGWTPFAVRAGDKLLREEKVDAIISTSAPVTAHIIARRLKIRHRLPWVVDLRDLWTQNHNYSYGPIRKWFDRRLELKTLSGADALVTVSRPWAKKLGALHKGKVTYAITNGFDPETAGAAPATLTAKFTITYTGLIYTGQQDTTRLFAALRDLVSDKVVDPADIEIRFYGISEDWLQKEAGQYGLAGVANQYGPVPRDVALQKQRESQLLLLLNWDDPQERGTYPGKVFEYLATGRPILATGGSEGDVVGELLKETGAGIHAVTIEATRSALRGLYAEFKSQGGLAPRGDESKLSKYTHREMARKFAEIMERLVAGPPSMRAV